MEASFSLAYKTKEIAVRKVFPAFPYSGTPCVILVRLFRTVEDAGPYGYGGKVSFCVSFLDTQSVSNKK